MALLQLALHNVANYSEPVLPLDDDQPDEWEVLARLALLLQGAGATADPAIVDDLMITSMVQGSVADETSPIHGRDADEILEALGAAHGARAASSTSCCAPGPTATASAPTPTACRSTRSIANPHGIDLGALEPRLPDVLRTPDGMIALAPGAAVADVARLHDGLDGRRDHPLRAHRPAPPALEQLVDAQRQRAREGQAPVHAAPPPRRRRRAWAWPTATPRWCGRGWARSRVPVEVTDAIRPGVVSIPHGWGHDVDGVADGAWPASTPA